MYILHLCKHHKVNIVFVIITYTSFSCPHSVHMCMLCKKISVNIFTKLDSHEHGHVFSAVESFHNKTRERVTLIWKYVVCILEQKSGVCTFIAKRQLKIIDFQKMYSKILLLQNVCMVYLCQIGWL